MMRAGEKHKRDLQIAASPHDYKRRAQEQWSANPCGAHVARDHTPDTARAVREVHRVLRGGGEAIVMLYNRASLYFRGAVVLLRGILLGELLKMSVEAIMSECVERSEAGGQPLVKAYTRRGAREQFKDFSRVEISVNQLTRDELGPAGGLMPEPVFQWLTRHFGWNLIIRAIK